MELSLLPLSPASVSTAARKARLRPDAFSCRCCSGARGSPDGTRRWFASLLAATAGSRRLPSSRLFQDSARWVARSDGLFCRWSSRRSRGDWRGGGRRLRGVYESESGKELTNLCTPFLRASKIPESEFTTLPNGLKYYDISVGTGAKAVKGSRVAVHYVAKWKGITFMTSRQGLGVGGGTPYGFDIGNSERGNVLKGLDLGVEGMKAGGQRLIIVPPELAYGKKGVQEIPPNATIELDVELLSVKQNSFGTPVKIIEG
ncbi:hypothetical protein ABZP36_001548 [Zizania latifolia]